MEETELTHISNRTHLGDNLLAMTNRQLEAWFGAGGLTVEVVANCDDAACSNCVTIEPARTAA